MSIKGYIPCSLVDWPGMLPAVIFIGGCNLNCWYCHNKELAQNPDRFPDLDLEEILRKAPHPNWTDGFVITGGEPTEDYAFYWYISTLKRAGFKIKIDTNGTNPRAIKGILPLVDLIAMDIKAPLADYKSVTGPVDIEAIKRSIKILRNSGKVQFRTTAAPGINVDQIQKELGAPLLIQPWKPTE